MKASPVTAYMSRNPHSIGRQQTMASAHAIMKEHGIRHLPVLEAGRVVGLVSDRDLNLIEALKDVDPTKVSVEEAMTQDPYVVSSTEPLGDIVREMATHKYGSAIVVDGSKLVGMFTTVDALRAFADTQTWEERHSS